MTTATVLLGGVLGHLCTCGHPDLWHREEAHGWTTLPEGGVRRRFIRGRCGSGDCTCGRYLMAYPPNQPSMVHPAYSSATGERIDYVIPPGSSEYGLRSCGCDHCDALYTQLTTTTGASA